MLDPLSADALKELLAEASPRLATPDAAAELVHRTGGNPLFARLLVDWR